MDLSDRGARTGAGEPARRSGLAAVVLMLLVGLAGTAAGAGSDSGDSDDSGSAWGSSSGSAAATRAEDPEYARAKRLVEDGRYEQAIERLQRIVARRDDADAYNLLGYSHRKLGKLDTALRYYERALAIKPDHRGAHEYIGETYLELGDLAAARRHLEFLDRDCTFGCPEYEELKAAIEAWQARRGSRKG